MTHRTTRRRFLNTTAAAGAVLGVDSGLLGKLPAVSAAEARLDPNAVRFGSGIEPLVQLLETTPRKRLLEEVAFKIRNGTSYREVLAALLLAGVRNVQPRPSVGFKFHAVLVVNSAHLASLASGTSDRWLPIFWALDYFKRSQSEERQKSGWTLPAVEERLVPPARKARQAFIKAIESWDEKAADAAAAGLVRTAGANEVYELLYHYGARDYRSIGHKAIYVANSWRTLQCIGWQHAEPVVRSLVYALLNHTGEPNPSTSDLQADRPWRHNQQLQETISDGWREGRLDAPATRELIEGLRTGSAEATADHAVKLLNAGVAPQSIWDAVMIGSGELLMQQPGIIGLHSLTTANALNFAFRTVADETTRRLVLLQACSFLPMFRQSAKERGKVRGRTVDDVEPANVEGKRAVEEIFADVSSNRDRAAAKVRGFLAGGGDPGNVIDAARQLIFFKGDDAHDYKYSSAVLEDFYHVSPKFRDMFLGLSVYNLCGSGDRDTPLVARTRQALDS